MLTVKFASLMEGLSLMAEWRFATEGYGELFVMTVWTALRLQ